MKLYYEIEVGQKRVGNDIVLETDAVEYEVDDFDIVCAFMRNYHPMAKVAVISLWTNSTAEQRAQFLAAIMRKHGSEIEDFFRQRALYGAFCPTIGEICSVGKVIDKNENGAQRANKQTLNINAELTKQYELTRNRAPKIGDLVLALLYNGRMTQWEFRGKKTGWVCVYGMGE